METLDHKMEPGKLNLGQALEEGMPWALKEEVFTIDLDFMKKV